MSLLENKNFYYNFACLLIYSRRDLTQHAKTINLIEKNFQKSSTIRKAMGILVLDAWAVSKEGITADLEAMKEVGLAALT